MPDAALTQIAKGAEVSWKSDLGYTYDGTVVAGPDGGGYYDVVTADGATANIHREKLVVKGATGDDVDPDLTVEQRASLRAERARQHANGRTADAMQSTYALLREDARRELGAEPEGDAIDDLRQQAADLVVAEAETLRDSIVASVEAKRSL